MEHLKSLVRRAQSRIDQATLEKKAEGRPDGLLCSYNARSRKTLVEHAQWETI